MPGPIRVGIGGWTFAPWRGGAFYPSGLPHAKELGFAGERLSAIEINATYHKLQKPESFAAWARAVPDGFVFAVKASRFCTNRKVLADGGEAVERFLDQGLVELGGKLGPILWQFMPTKRFDPDDFGAFLRLLPDNWKGIGLRHAVEVRHRSFDDPAFLALARSHRVAVCFADKPGYPSLDEPTAGFTYARLQAAIADEPTGYPPDALDDWAERASGWAARGDVFVFMINGAKERAPAAALALIERLSR